MDTSFGLAKDTIYVIHDWSQLLSIPSTIPNVKCYVQIINDDLCCGTMIAIFNSESHFDYIKFFVSGDHSKIVDCCSLTYSVNEALNVLKTFGYNVEYASFDISRSTRDLLFSYYQLGFRYVFKSTVDGNIYVSKDNSPDLITGTSCSASPNFKYCDFTFLDPGVGQSISNLLGIKDCSCDCC